MLDRFQRRRGREHGADGEFRGPEKRPFSPETGHCLRRSEKRRLAGLLFRVNPP
jgi:hypothetical protein